MELTSVTEWVPPAQVPMKLTASQYIRSLVIDQARGLHCIQSDRNMQYVGWQQQLPQDYNQWTLYQFFFTEEVRDFIGAAVSDNILATTQTQLLVPPRAIMHVMTTVYNSYQPTVGDIYSRYIIPCDINTNDLDVLVKRTVEWITSFIRAEILMKKNNEQMTIWDTVYGDFNKQGLRAHAPIKLREKHPQYMAFNMNY